MDALFMENHTNLMLEGTFQIPSLTRPLNPRQFPPCPRAHSQWQNWDSNPLFQTLCSVLLFCTMWTSHMPGQRELFVTPTTCGHSRGISPNFEGRVRGVPSPPYQKREKCPWLELRLRFPIMNNTKQDYISAIWVNSIWGYVWQPNRT